MNIKSSQSPVSEYAAPALLRVAASMVYDSLLIAALSIAYGALVVGLHVLVYGAPAAGQRIQWSLLSSLFISAGWLVVLILFYVYFWRRFGQTLGMKTWRLQLVSSSNGQLATYRQCFARSICAIFSLVFFGVGYWYSLLNSQHRLLHDLVSGTQLIVLKKNPN